VSEGIVFENERIGGRKEEGRREEEGRNEERGGRDEEEKITCIFVRQQHVQMAQDPHIF
jgi:hypothetical protein